MDGRARGGGDHTDALGMGGQRPFAGGVEQSLRAQPGLELLKGHRQCPRAVGDHAIHDELVLPAGGIGRHAAVSHHLHAVLGVKLHTHHGVFEHHRRDDAVGVLEGEVEMPRRVELRTRDLPLHPHVLQVGVSLQEHLDVLVELADAEGIGAVGMLHGGTPF